MRDLDLRGLKCPLPTLKARKALNGAAPGTRIRVVADDPMAAIDLPHFLGGSPHRLVDSGREADGTELWFVVEAGAAPSDRIDRDGPSS
ncbi:sulfurtransferase TusA family protein [Fulvimarina sp. 2208YS6-2-32]|uniref:Sulfurtransferase TusA family protein n=1 Tax=Fulvimarina uroteuthidis TaxID=3098149 RepID=A0ABU5HZ09_9HYPH|nr:sulfurtransferase TusA family protein [Fulvimarina sp. 2208YS6-2-32]MDY8108358.1 sulfurtransferase TusA family protein [Fulvimarina sp. 2208YS6-2-32]